MKIYVAGKWSELKNVKRVMEMLKSRGHIVTVDWTTHDHPNKSRDYAIQDIEGIRECDILIACMWTPSIFYKGAWIEVGAALALDKRVVFIGTDISSVFLGHPNCRIFNFKEEAFDFIDSLEFDRDYNKSLVNSDHYVMGL